VCSERRVIVVPISYIDVSLLCLTGAAPFFVYWIAFGISHPRMVEKESLGKSYRKMFAGL
jgi:hypothetical protein